MKYTSPLFFIIFSYFTVSGQAPTNLRVYEGLTAEAAKFISSNFFSGDRIPTVKPELQGDYKVLYPAFSKNLTDNGLTLSDEGAAIYLKTAAVTYSSPFTKSFLGDYHIERTAVISGDMGSSDTRFRFESIDTVRLSEVPDLENKGFPFTMSVIPKEPFWGSLTNVAIAAGATVLAVILFFTVRTN